MLVFKFPIMIFIFTYSICHGRRKLNVTYVTKLDGIMCVCVCISSHRKGFSWLKQNKYARDQASDVVPRKLLSVKYLCRHVIGNHSRYFKASNCARVSIKPGRTMRSKRHVDNPSHCNKVSSIGGDGIVFFVLSSYWKKLSIIRISINRVFFQYIHFRSA